ncbi:HAD family hydrolase [Variovorax sp. YR752]|uniref:HAD family hydrolase n=1 Tax=Variovorax sp. YR752 TaxID=1884383 RepID=UPI003137E9D5
MARPVIALDADGVLLDFHLAYAMAWQRAFGEYPRERDPQAYWPIDRWEVPRLRLFKKARFRSTFDDQFWSTVPAIDGAIEACHRLHDAGYQLVCVSALDARFEAARRDNLKNLGFPIQRVIATGHHESMRSPKADAVEAIGAEVFVDDYLPYFRGIPDAVHAALILRAPNGSPNVGIDLAWVSSSHQDLPAFVDHWLSR